MAIWDFGGCPCGLSRECECKNKTKTGPAEKEGQKKTSLNKEKPNMTLNTIPHFDPLSFATNLTKNAVGFDELFSKFADMAKTAGYPPYNIKKTDDNTYVIEMAVAGFGKHDIELTLENNVMTIRGEVKRDENDDYLFKGIADRAFTRKFTLADTIEIKNADLINGMLRIWLERFIPESKKPKKIDIKTEQDEKVGKTFLRD